MSIKPFNDNNSIRGVAFVFGFHAELNWSVVHDAVNKAKELDIFSANGSFEDIIYPSFVHSPNVVYEDNILGGFSYKGADWNVTLDKYGIVVRCISYTRCR